MIHWFTKFSYTGKPQVVSRYILSNLWCKSSQLFVGQAMYVCGEKTMNEDLSSVSGFGRDGSP
jgi:hypothetical protein